MQCHKTCSRAIPLVAGILSFAAPVLAQDVPSQAVSRDIDQILKSIQDSDTNRPRSEQHVSEALHFLRRKDGLLRVLVAPPSRYFPVSSMVRSDPQAVAKGFLQEHKRAFGLEDGLFSLVPKAMKREAKRSHVRLDQAYAGIPVFAAQAVVQLNEEGNVEYVSSDTMTDRDVLDLEGDWAAPLMGQVEAEHVAVATLMGENVGMQFHAEPATLMIYQPGIVGNAGSVRVVWHTKIVSVPDPWVAERVLVNAHSGEIALHALS